MSKWAVLSGGGAKGAVQVGMLRAKLDQNPNLDYKGYAGISVGALNSCFLSQGKLKNTLPLLEDIWLKKIKGNRSVWRHNLYWWLAVSIIIIAAIFAVFVLSLSLHWPIFVIILTASALLASLFLPYLSLKLVKSVYSSKPLSEIVYKNYNPKNTTDANKSLFVGAVSWKKGIYEVVSHYNRNIHEWILASSAFPIFLTSRFIQGLYFTDGGVRDIAPLSVAIENGATEVDVYLCSPLLSSEDDLLPSIPEQIMRVIEIMSNEILRNDILEISKLHPDIKITIYMPTHKLIKNALNFKSREIRRMYQEGKMAISRPLTPEQAYEAILRR